MADLRAQLPLATTTIGIDIDETATLTTGPNWASFTLTRRADGARIGIGRGQTMGDGSELVLSPGPARTEADLIDLNRAAVVLYTRLVEKGAIDPPSPLERPRPPQPAGM